MTRIAMQLTENLLATVGELFEVEDTNVFGDKTYIVVEMTSPTEFKLNLMNEEEIFQAAAADSDMQIISV